LGAFQIDDAQIGLRQMGQQVAPHFLGLHGLEHLVDVAAEHHIAGKGQRKHGYMVRLSSLRSAASGRVLSTSAFSSQPRRACPTPYCRLVKSNVLCASELMLTSTPSSLALWHWLSRRSRRSGWAFSSRKQPRCLAWRMMCSMSIS